MPAVHGVVTGRVCVFTFPQQRLWSGQVVAGEGEIPAVRMHWRLNIPTQHVKPYLNRGTLGANDLSTRASQGWMAADLDCRENFDLLKTLRRGYRASVINTLFVSPVILLSIFWVRASHINIPSLNFIQLKLPTF
jgi:hypothetical protein